MSARELQVQAYRVWSHSTDLQYRYHTFHYLLLVGEICTRLQAARADRAGWTASLKLICA